MRNSEAKHYIQKLSKRSINNCIRKMYLKNGTILDFSNPITIICGLNGVGKTRIIETINNMFGYLDSDANVLDCETIEIGNKRLKIEEIINKKQEFYTIHFNAKVVERTRDYLNQNNIDELKEGVDPNELNQKEIKELNYLVGRNYKKCIIYEFNDEFEDQISFPYYFEVVVDTSVKYTSLDMGTGEHIIVMFYYLIWKLSKDRSNTLNKLFLIDELESYISVRSQYNLMHSIAKISCDCNVQFIISTHSPFVIKNIPIEFIRLIKIDGGEPKFRDQNIELNKIMDYLDLVEKNKPNIRFLVEDELAKTYLDIILNYFDFDYLYSIDNYKGYGNIKKELDKSNGDNNCIKLGIFDGDMRKNEELNNNKRVLFLPGDDDFESILIAYLSKKDNLTKFSKELQLNSDVIELLMDKYPQIDKHDLINDMKLQLNIDIKRIIQSLINLKVVDISCFIGELFIRINDLKS